MKITKTFTSDISGEEHKTFATFPPFAPGRRGETSESMLTASVRRFGDDNLSGERTVSLLISDAEAELLASLVADIRISPSPGAFSIFDTKDGWSTEVEIDSCDSKVFLSWFGRSPPGWVGVETLCKSMDRLLYERGTHAD